MAQHDGLFGIFFNVDNHFLVVCHGKVDALGTLLRQRNGRESLLDFLFHLVYVEVADHDNGLQVGPIPLLVIVAQILIREVVDDFHRADGQAVFVLCTCIHFRHGQFHESLDGLSGTARTPLLMNDTALLVYLVVLQQQIVAPVVQHQQARVDDAFAFQRSRPDVIDGLVDTGIGIQVCTELHADGLAPGHNAQFLALAGEILRAVEGHVL